MTHAPRSLSRLRSLGLSLVEMMVSLTIGLLLTVGLFSMFTTSSQAFKVQDDFARMQENATVGLRYIGDSVRHAGFFGYVLDANNIVNQGVAMDATDCGLANWALNLTQPLTGFDLTTLNVNATLPCINASNFQNGQVLVTRSAIGIRIPDPNSDGDVSDGIAAQTNFNTTIYVQSDPNAGLMFYGSNFAALRGAGTTRRLPNNNDVDVFQLSALVYFIRPCSRPTGSAGTVCQAGDDGGQPIPTLVRKELTGSGMVEAPLVEGIERIDFRYGLDDSNDGVPDRFVRAPTAAEWVNVVSVKVSLLVRSPSLIRDYDDSGKNYDLDGDNVVDFNCNPALATPLPVACYYKRKVFSQSFQVRNLAQRRGA